MSSAVLVSGHMGGLGADMARLFAESGYFVIGLDRHGGSKFAHMETALDFSTLGQDQEAFNEALDSVERELGNRKLRAVINNAAEQLLGNLSELEAGQMMQSFMVNAVAPVEITRKLLKRLEESQGTVVNITSIHVDQTKAGFGAYAASKAALSSYSRSLAIECGRRVRCVEIRPAAVATPMLEAGFADSPAKRELLNEFHPTGRIASPRELAELVKAVVELEAAFINGSVIKFDGGISSCLSDPDQLGSSE